MPFQYLTTNTLITQNFINDHVNRNIDEITSHILSLKESNQQSKYWLAISSLFEIETINDHSYLEKVFDALFDNVEICYITDLQYCMLYYCTFHNLYETTVWLMEKEEFESAFYKLLKKSFKMSHYDFGKRNILTNICSIDLEEGEEPELFTYFMALPNVEDNMHINNNLALKYALENEQPYMIRRLINLPNVQDNIDDETATLIQKQISGYIITKSPIPGR